MWSHLYINPYNLSLQYQDNIKLTSDASKEKYQSED